MVVNVSVQSWRRPLLTTTTVIKLVLRLPWVAVSCMCSTDDKGYANIGQESVTWLRRHRQSGLCRTDWQRLRVRTGGGCVAICSSAQLYSSSAGIENNNIIIIIIIIIWAFAECLVKSPERFTVATIALFSASEQTHCALVECECEWVSLYTARFEYPPKWCT